MYRNSQPIKIIIQMKTCLIYGLILFTTIVSAQRKAPIYIQPLGKVNTTTIHKVKKSMELFYHRSCEIKPMVNFTPDILADSKTRYEAGNILRKFSSNKNVLIITEKDIATAKGNIKEWGVFGFGYRPGSTCVISTYRLKRKVVNAQFIDRLNKVAIHEIGHNIGLPHCTSGNKHCLMNDAGGTIAQVDNEQILFCNKCNSLIK